MDIDESNNQNLRQGDASVSGGGVDYGLDGADLVSADAQGATGATQAYSESDDSSAFGANGEDISAQILALIQENHHLQLNLPLLLPDLAKRLETQD